MKRSLLLSVAVSLFLANFGMTQDMEEVFEPFPESQRELLVRGQFSDLEEALYGAIRKVVDGKTLEAILADERLMHWVTAAELIRLTGADHMEALYGRGQKYIRFLMVFLQDPEWMQLYLRAGLVPTNTEVGLRVLADIWAVDGQAKDFRNYLSLATGIASSWGAGRNAPRVQLAEHHPSPGKKCNPVWRYRFFKRSHQQEKLHPGFMKLQPWEIRFLVASGVDDASFQYCQDNINLPWEQYDGACWFANYKGGSDFGDSIHNGLLFYAPCSNDIGIVQKTVEQGGVCGALSTLGSIAAAARGIPSYTVGQPGHCAYAIRLKRGEWRGGFGGPIGGMKEYIFFDGLDPVSRDLMEAVFADDANVEQSYREASLARVLVAAGKDNLARAAWERAIKTAPLNAFFRQDYQQFIEERFLFSKKQWCDYACNLLNDFEGHGFAALEILKDLQPKFLEGQSDQTKLDYFAKVHKMLATTPMAWSIKPDGIFEFQTNMLQQPESCSKLFEIVLKQHFNKGDGALFGFALNWGVKQFVEQGQEEYFDRAFQAAVRMENRTSGSAPLDAKALSNNLGQAISGAEKARARGAFQTLSKFAAPFCHNESGPSVDQFDCPPGELASEGGFIMLSSYQRGRDRPCDHANVLAKKPGFLCTESQNNPFVMIELPQPIKMSGVLLVKARNNQDLIKNIKVSRSTDGATWYEVASTDNMPYQWKIVTPETPEVRWIKVESTKPDKNYLLMRNILVFKSER